MQKAICVTNDSTVRLAPTRAPLPSQNGALSVLQEMKLPKPISLGKVLERKVGQGQKRKSETRRRKTSGQCSFQDFILNCLPPGSQNLVQVPSLFPSLQSAACADLAGTFQSIAPGQ